LVKLGANVSVYDIDRQQCNDLAMEIRHSLNSEINVEEELGEALVKYRRLIDASPAANIIGEEHIFEDTIIAAPGIPHGLSADALKKISDRFLHDPLQIGVATMAIGIAAAELVTENGHRR
jgi:pyrrolysine biosynthesis protein PylD